MRFIFSSISAGPPICLSFARFAFVRSVRHAYLRTLRTKQLQPKTGINALRRDAGFPLPIRSPTDDVRVRAAGKNGLAIGRDRDRQHRPSVNFEGALRPAGRQVPEVVHVIVPDRCSHRPIGGEGHAADIAGMSVDFPNFSTIGVPKPNRAIGLRPSGFACRRQIRQWRERRRCGRSSEIPLSS